MERFLTPPISTTKGIGGIIKTLPEDFVVSEMIEEDLKLDPRKEKFHLPGKPGLFLHFVLIKRDIDSINALNLISKIWGIQRDHFGIAGTKDKKALTAQRVSVWGVKERFEKGNIKEIVLPKIKTKNLCLRLREVKLGDLWGNSFTIVIRGIEQQISEIQNKVNSILSELKELGGAANSFGVQRFGETRPITHIVGKLLLKGNIREALRVYVGRVFKSEPKEVRMARSVFWEEEKIREALELFPSYLRTERTILYQLLKKRDFYQTFLTLPLQLKKLFIHAYQAYLFNNYLVLRISKYGKNLSKAILGEKVKRDRIFAPIFGLKTDLVGEVKDIYKCILEKEGISKEDFKKDFIRKIGGRGTFRAISFYPQNVELRNISKDELDKEKMKATLDVKLQKGTYATEFLKEIMKNKQSTTKFMINFD